MPAAAAIAIYFGIGFAEATRRLDGMHARRLLVIFAAGLQFLMLVYSPRNQIPSQADRAAGEKLLERVWNIPGEVYWAPMQAQEMAVVDVLQDSQSAELGEFLEADLAGAVASGRYSAFVFDRRTFALWSPDFDAHYALVDADLTGGPFYPVTGARRKPTFLFARRAR